MGSYMMLSDENTLNSINPFVIGGPGAKNKPFGYAPDIKPCDSGTWNNVQDKPACMWGITANTNGSFLTEGCLPIKNPKPCYMDRPLEPTRDIVPDLYTLIPYTEKTLEQKLEQQQKMKWIPIGVVFIILFIIAYIHIIKRL